MSPRTRLTRWLRGGVAVAMAVGVLAGTHAPAVAVQQPEDVTLDGLELGTDWVNTPGPIRARDLRGKVVLVDFWTFCCINCHHVLPDLTMLEEKYKDELVVIGVHTPKFPAERDLDNLRGKVREYRIRHPVVSDANQAIWDHYGVASWPTLAVFDAAGRLRRVVSGEGKGKVLDKLIGELAAEARTQGILDATPVKFFPESEKPHESPLHYPGKVLADPAGKRLFISDTGNNRIVVTDPHGKLIRTIGGGGAGLVDGTAEKATFNRPQGMCLHDGTLYVADTENHAIRAVDLEEGKVRTVAGNGKQSHHHRVGGGGGGGAAAGETELNSPWDVLALPEGKDLYIAMAGPHQIWKLDLVANKVGVWAGTGVEGIKDAVALESADFAQPSGLATDGKTLFVADSETSSLRAVSLHPGGGHRVQTIVGSGLFVFGDIDGQGPQVRLQHCLGLAYGHEKLYVADTYNNKIKVCDPRSRVVKALAGSPKAEAGATDYPVMFNQPGGLSVAGQTLYVADTNNHKVRTIDLASGKVKTLELQGLTTPKAPAGPPRFLNRTPIAAPPARVAPGRRVVFDVRLVLPADVKLNPDTPMPYLVESPRRRGALAESAATAGDRISPPAASFQVVAPLAEEAREGETLDLKLSVSTFQCRGGAEGYCTIKSYVWTVPITFAADAGDRVKLTNPDTTK